MDAPSVALGAAITAIAVVGLYYAIRPRIRSTVAAAVEAKILATNFQAGPINLGHIPREMAHLVATAVADGIAEALP